MYIDADFIIKAASLLSALGALVAAVVAVYKVLENNKKQNEFINAMQEEQTLICYGLRGALQGLVEQGCNGPCKDALARLDKHLNKSAHPHIPEGGDGRAAGEQKDETQEEAHRNDGLDLAARLYLSGYLYRYHDTAVPGLRLGAGYPCNLCVCHTGRGVRYPGVDKDQQG